MTRSHSFSLLLAFTVLGTGGDAHAQGIAGIMAGIRDGGGWVGVPIEGGVGSFSTVPLPTAGLTLTGCVNVWYGHSGTFQITARDRADDSVLEVTAEPGIGVPFSHEFGLQAQIDFDFRWSEPRDTTLVLWVGLDIRGEGPEAACDPGYGSPDRAASAFQEDVDRAVASAAVPALVVTTTTPLIPFSP